MGTSSYSGSKPTGPDVATMSEDDHVPKIDDETASVVVVTPEEPADKSEDAAADRAESGMYMYAGCATEMLTVCV